MIPNVASEHPQRISGEAGASAPEKPTHAGRLYALDFARTLAAFAVVLAHWPQHLLAPGEFGQPYSASPFFAWLGPLFVHGSTAVTFFFCLSGFVFYWLYAGSVRDRSIDFSHFGVLRLSRLYPLHLATLLACVPLQVLYLHMTGKGPFAYPASDLYHFVLNLLSIQYWGFQRDFSWNGPSWSISVEVALYIVFFLACRVWRPSVLQTLVLAAAAMPLARCSSIAHAAVPFFMGGATWFACKWLGEQTSVATTSAVMAVTGASWLLLPEALSWVAGLPGAVLAGVPGVAPVEKLLAEVMRIVAGRIYELWLFPTAILSLALAERTFRGVPWARLDGIGNLSFSVYLLHFPLQVVFVCLALAWHLPSDVFTWPAVLLLYLAALAGLGYASYWWLERPAMLALRGAGAVQRGALRRA